MYQEKIKLNDIGHILFWPGIVFEDLRRKKQELQQKLERKPYTIT